MPANRESNHRSIVIVGAGLAGLACAVVLAAKGFRTTLVGPPGNVGDTRTTALLDGSIQALARAGIAIAGHSEAAPLRVMSIVDATQRLLRARPIAFKAEEIGLEAFGWNIPNGALTGILQAHLRDAGVEIRDHDLDLAAEQVGHHRWVAAIRHPDDVGAGSLL